MSRVNLPFRKSKPVINPRLRNRSKPASGSRLTQNRTFSYAANRSQTDFNTGREASQHKPPIRQLSNKVQKLRRHFGWLLLAVASIGAVGYELQLSTLPKVVSVVQSSDAPFLQDTSVYGHKAETLFNATAANRNKLTVNTTDIAQQLKKQFPELLDVSITLPLIGDRPVVYIRPAMPVLLLSSVNENTYVIDEYGRAVAEKAGNWDKVQVPLVTDQSGIQVQVGNQVLPRSATTFISTIIAQLKAQHIPIKSLVLPVAASELDVYIDGMPYYVKFNMHDADSGEAALQAGTYIATSKQLTAQGITPAQYIDVRLQGRAYYK